MVSTNRNRETFLVNERVPRGKVRLIDADGNMRGLVDTAAALAEAREVGLDLIMVSQGKDCPICKIMDFGKYKYDLEKKKQKAKKSQTKIVVKEIKFSPKTSDHDYSYRRDHIIEFIEKGYYVKATVFYKGRTILHQEKGYELLQRLIGELQELVIIDKKPQMKGRSLSVVLMPKKKK